MKKDTDWSMFQQYFCFYFSSEIVGKLLIAISDCCLCLAQSPVMEADMAV